MDKVYVTKFQPDWDFLPATEYGEVVFLTEHEMKPEPTVGAYNDLIVKELRDGLEDYLPRHDYVVLTASATNNFKVANILHAKGGRHNILRWNGRSRHYDLFKL